MKSSRQVYSPRKGETVRGWIFDLYSYRAGETVVWIKTESGRCSRLVDKWNPFFYVSAPSHADLVRLTWYLPQNDLDVKCEFVDKFVDLLDCRRTRVLRLTVPDIVSLRSLATFIWSLGDYGKYRLWNVDIPLSQMYLCDKNLFPLAYVEASVTDDGVAWNLLDHAEDVEYPGWYVEPSKGGAGGFIDHGVHFTDALRWLFESEVKTIAARTANLTYKDIKVEDYGVAILTFENGNIATVESTWHAADWYGPLSSPELCMVTGTEGEIIVHYHKSPQLEVVGKKEPFKGRTYFDWAGEERYEICYRAILEHFAECILKDEKPTVTTEDGRKALEICLAAYRSAKNNEFVKLPL